MISFVHFSDISEEINLDKICKHDKETDFVNAELLHQYIHVLDLHTTVTLKCKNKIDIFIELFMSLNE